MFPIGDDNSTRRSTPYVTYVLIAINVLVFLLELQNGQDFIREWAFVPVRFGADPATASSIFLTTFTDIVGMGLMLMLATTLVSA